MMPVVGTGTVRRIVAVLLLKSVICNTCKAFQSGSASVFNKSTRISAPCTALNNIFGKKKEPEPEPEQEPENTKTFLSKHGGTLLKVGLPSFITGGLVTLGVLFLPLVADYYAAFDEKMPNFYNKDNPSQISTDKNNMNNVNQPVILFETILNDLNNAYVDDVDIQKLFETGIKAMTASLDPYTEFESRSEAIEMEESVSGRYGGVGLVIRGGTNLADELDEEPSSVEKIEVDNPASGNPNIKDTTPPVAVKDGGGTAPNMDKSISRENDEEDDAIERKKAREKSREDGIRVVSAFEGYAYDAGMRVGDKLLAIDDFEITRNTNVEEVRNHLRGVPGTDVTINFLRDGVGNNEPQSITLKRAVVQIPDVKYFGFIGDPKDGIGYIDLSGFANNAGREVRFAIRALQHGAEMLAKNDEATDDRGPFNLADADPTKLKALVLDLRSNPGGLLTSAVDVATLFVPNGSDIVSAKGRGFPETLYRSKTNPVLDPNTRLAVLVNDQTASAAEIVSGAIQDLDVGVVVGKGRTFGKGLVQNVQDLPYQTALKYTVAKYYTPSGRCIQSTEYKAGGRGDKLLASSDGNGSNAAKFKSKKVSDKDRNVFHTAHGRIVKDGGGVEVDYKVEPQKASPLEVILLNSGSYSDYAAEWSKSHQLTDQFKVDDTTYKDFQRFVEKRQADGEMKLEVLYDSQLKELQKKLKASKFDSSRREVEKLRADIVKDVKQDFGKFKGEIIEDIEQSILARYLPDSMIIARGLKSDVQVKETVKMLKDAKEFNRLLARDVNELGADKGQADKNPVASGRFPSL